MAQSLPVEGEEISSSIYLWTWAHIQLLISNYSCVEKNKTNLRTSKFEENKNGDSTWLWQSPQVVGKWLEFGNHGLNGSLCSSAPLPIYSWLSCQINSSHMLLGPEHSLVLNLQGHPRHLQNKGSQPALSTRLSPRSSKATFTASVPFPSLSMLRFFCFFLTKMLNTHYTATNLCLSNVQLSGTKRTKRRVLGYLLSTYYVPPAVNLPWSSPP